MKPTKPIKHKSLDTVLTNMAIKGIKNALKPKPEPKKETKKSVGSKTASKEKVETQKQEPLTTFGAPKYNRLFDLMKDIVNIHKQSREKVNQKVDKTPKKNTTQKTKTSTDEPEIVYGEPLDTPHVLKPKTKIEPKEKIIIEPEPVIKEEPKNTERPYRAIDSFKKQPNRTKDGEYPHPLYKINDLFHHTAEPHIGAVKYITTVNGNGHPIVQPIDDSGSNVKIAFQANPKNLFENNE